MSKTAIITGIYGQDGSLLAETLIDGGHRVVGLVRKRRSERTEKSANVQIIETDIADFGAMRAIFADSKPDECYHLAAAHHSSEGVATDMRAEMMRTNFVSTQAITDAILSEAPDCRLLYAGSSQMFTATAAPTIVNQSSCYRPSTFYGVTKAASAHLIDMLRRKNGLFGCVAILFNHESPLRSPQFLTRKVTMAAAAARKILDKGMPIRPLIEIRNPSAKTDWSSARDFVRAMPMMLGHPAPGDYTLASGRARSVGDLVDSAFSHAGVSDWRLFVALGEQPQGAKFILGDAGETSDCLGWKPCISFDDMIAEMVKHDVAALREATDRPERIN
jgi:GDPmannose 4,6-dehydratase